MPMSLAQVTKRGLGKAKWPPAWMVQHVRRVLGLRALDPLPRCKARNYRLAQRLGPEHLGDGHCCPLCRCTRVAGSGTRGDYWGFVKKGMTEYDYGHYGVGYCRSHDTHFRMAHKDRLMDAQVRSLQMHGEVRDSFPVAARTDADTARANLEIRRGTDLLLKWLRNFEDLCKEGEPTEWVLGRLEKMSDKTRIKLAIELAKAVASLAVDEHRVNSNQFVSLDRLLVLIDRMVRMKDALGLTDEQKEMYLKRLREIWSPSEVRGK
jgi:hypothetical protein